jgi:hypothetical protein
VQARTRAGRVSTPWDEAWARALARELDELHERVPEVVVVAAGARDAEAMGDDLFSAATAGESCAAGRDRGRAAAESLAALA